MAKGRLLHKVFYAHVEAGELPVAARYLYIGLITHADDAGRIKANPKYLKATIFPFDEDIKAETIRQWRDMLCKSGLVKLYSVDGQEYLCHPHWEKWQPLRKDRVQESECPSPLRHSARVPDGAATKCQPDVNQASTAGQADGKHVATDGCPNLTEPNLRTTSSAAEAPDAPAVHKSQSPAGKPYTQEFETFWESYPRKVGKSAAFSRWQSRGPPIADVLKALAVQKCCRQWEDVSLIPHPETWLNQRRWEDDPSAYGPAKPKQDNSAYCEADAMQGEPHG